MRVCTAVIRCYVSRL